MLHPLNDDELPQAPAISMDRLRSLLSDLPGDWQIVADESTQLLLLDADDQPHGYVDLMRGTIALVDGLDDGNDEDSS